MYYKKIIKTSILFFLIFFLFACASLTKEKQRKYLEYNTLELSFGFAYPSHWYVFETANGVKISNKIEMLTIPDVQTASKKRKIFSPRVFEGILYFTDVEELKQVYKEYQNVVPSVLTTVVEKNTNRRDTVKKEVLINAIGDLGVFAEFASKTEINRLKQLYKDALLQEMPQYVRGAYFEDVLLLVALKYGKYKNKDMLEMHITLLYKVNDSFTAGYIGTYNTGIAVNTRQLPNTWWAEQNFIDDYLNILFLQEMINVIRTTKKI